MLRDLVFIDVETTGLDVTRHELIEVAAIRVTHDLSRTVLGPLVLRVRPHRLDVADSSALDLVGYSEAEWRDACEVSVALDWLWPMLMGATPAGHNVTFDLRFLEAAARAANKGDLPVDYHRVDTASLAWLLTQSGESERASLQPVCDVLQVERARSHRALDDALASLEVARRIAFRWNMALVATEAA